jgi:ComF family protein
LTDPLSTLMYQAWDRYSELHSIQGLVPVPLHSANHYERGYNQAVLLAQALSCRLGLPCWENALIRIRRTRPQFRLGKPERFANLQGSIMAASHRSLKGMRLLLIDDVCTTGATLRECALALRRAGAKRIQALVLARDL